MVECRELARWIGGDGTLTKASGMSAGSGGEVLAARFWREDSWPTGALGAEDFWLAELAVGKWRDAKCHALGSA
jgi:hypothetical protein